MKLVPFMTSACGNDADHAFSNAVAIAQIDHGTNGATGTIADKEHYYMIKADKGKNPFDWAREQLELEDVHESDPWGCNCIQLDENEYLFFGHSRLAGLDSDKELTFM